MSSSRGSPATPTSNPSIYHSTGRRPYVKSNMDELGKKILSDSDTLSPSLTSDQIKYCKDAFQVLQDKVQRKLIDAEFASLTARSMPSHNLMGRLNTAQLVQNQPKNRYLDILPFDDTRVILQSPAGSTSSDYINANFITNPFVSNISQFIATQGPLRSTVADFWEMVVQQSCPVVVMLTDLADGSRAKCASYFPAEVEQVEHHGRFRITTKSVVYSKHSIAKRILEVGTIKGEPLHTVLHFQYLDWPDHGVPSSTRPIREIFKYLYSIPVDAGPFVIHCSAGIGRTGTYCTIDHTVRRILIGDLTSTDIEETVKLFREQRIGMVQTKAQYHFCYAAVIEVLESLLASR